MKSIWKIYDNDKKKVLNEKSYRSKKEAEEGKIRITRVRIASNQSHNLTVFNAGYIVKEKDIYNLQCDLDRLEYFKSSNDSEKVQEYLELIASHVNDLLNDEE